MWTTTLEWNLTLDNLMRCGHVLVNRYCMCCANAESVDHLFLHCPVATRLWGFICSLFGVVWVQPKGVLDMLWAWPAAQIGHRRRRRRVWLLASLCLMWLVWLERNR